MKGKFFTFEGIDGSGKDEQLFAFAKALKNGCKYFSGNKYMPLWLTREPTKLTSPGKEISRLLKTNHVSPKQATQYFVADRILHTIEYINPYLKTSHVLSSRYDLSTLSFQLAQGISFDFLYKAHDYGAGMTRIPDITFVFDVPAKVALQRIDKRGSKREFFETDLFQQKVVRAQEYCLHELARRDNRTILRINANQPIPRVTDEMLRKAAPYCKDW